MKRNHFFWIICLLLLVSCLENPKNKMYVKSVQLPGKDRIDWFFYSEITGFSQSYITLNSDKKNVFFESFSMTDLRLKADTLFIFLSRNKYKLYENKIELLPNLKIVIDTLGNRWNDAVSRIGRLKDSINIFEPHFVESFCSKPCKRGEISDKSSHFINEKR